MKTRWNSTARGAALLLIFSLAGCGKKKPEEPETTGPQSVQGGILESVQKTADAANQRTREVKEAADAAR